MKWVLVLFLACGPLVAAQEPEWKIGDPVSPSDLPEGVSYEGATLSRVEPDSITIMHSAGVAKFPLSKLSPEAQVKFGYDPAKAAAYVEEQKKKREAAIAVLSQDLAKQDAEKKAKAEADAKNQAEEESKWVYVGVPTDEFRNYCYALADQWNAVKYANLGAGNGCLIGAPKSGPYKGVMGPELGKILADQYKAKFSGKQIYLRVAAGEEYVYYVPDLRSKEYAGPDIEMKRKAPKKQERLDYFP